MKSPVPPCAFLLLLVLAWGPEPARAGGVESSRPYAVVDTGQVRCYDARVETPYPTAGSPFHGQDAHYGGHPPRYRKHGDGTVSDLVTGLMWQADPGAKMTWAEARAGAAACRLGGHANWRLPTIKELYSLIRFDGTDPDPRSGNAEAERPFIDADVFAFRYGDPTQGERVIDAQFATATKYVTTTMRGDETVFGVNFADGRIKGYGLRDPRGRGEKTFFVLYVRGNPAYGKNDFVDNENGTVTDRATGLTWMQLDSGHLKAGGSADGGMTWQEALHWAETLDYAGHADWRLPNAKELQSIVDYTRSPATSRSAAIDPIFASSPIEAEDGKTDFPNMWSSTTHVRGGDGPAAVYVAFGRSLGWMRDRQGGYQLLDVHGAGSQRSDPKAGDASAFPRGRGPQGDVIRILNHVRCVRGGAATPRKEGPPLRTVASRPAGTGGGEVQPPPDSLPAGPPPPGGGGPFVRRLDRDGDGRISREEFDGPPDHFAHFDRNQDGFIDADEAPSGPPPGRRPPPRRGR